MVKINGFERDEKCERCKEVTPELAEQCDGTDASYQMATEETSEYPKKLHKVTFFVEEMNVEMVESLVQDIFQEYGLENPHSFMVEEVDDSFPKRLLLENMEIDPQSVKLEFQEDRDSNKKYYSYLNKAAIMRIRHESPM